MLIMEQVIRTLDWWLDSGLELTYSEGAMDRASERGHVAVLEWWKRSGLEIRHTHKALDGASMSGHVDVLNWWKASGLELLYSYTAMDGVQRPFVQCPSVKVLEWWAASGLELRCSEDALAWARQGGKQDVVAWWESSGINLEESVTERWERERQERIQRRRTRIEKVIEGPTVDGGAGSDYWSDDSLGFGLFD
ncbi:hypothetical protein HDV00_001791 [Rhizophlyctis rosea]|nr:hypothetical protein HDV00_001791 [Rhizophlyctis rosea]